ncbi:MAG: outer membrane lipoprotein carrier protein LolA [Methylococcaceae bacterium]|nr:outer membrane lipoprotein carrier protein LolA [Methylococcaceae bacterium]
MRRALCLLLAFLPFAGFADNSGVAELLARIQNSGEAKFRYQETRTLELASSPWHGEGYMLSGAYGILIKLQLKPKRIIMALTDQRMYYWDPEQKQRHSAPLGAGGPGAEQITVLRSILQGQSQALQPTHDFVSEKKGQRWTLRVTPKPGQGHEDGPSLKISGDDDDNQRNILISQSDGESTEYKMVKASEDQAANYSISRLLQEAIGD